MADMYGSHFEYGGVSSKTHGMIIANVETTRFTQVAGTIAGVTIFNKSGKRNYLIDDDYSGSPLSFEVDIITDDERALTSAERRTMERWLFNRRNYKKLYLSGDSECADVNAGALSKYALKTVGGVNGIAYAGISIANNTPAARVNVYFALEDGYSASNYTFTLDDASVAASVEASRCRVSTSNIYPDKFDERHTIVVSDGTSMLTVEFCVLSYAYNALLNTPSSSSTHQVAVDIYNLFMNNNGTEYVDGEAKRLYMNCRFVNPTYLEYEGGIVGYKATLEADCGYWWQDAITKTFTFNHASASSSTTISIPVDTDIDDYTYPRISVTMNANGGDFAIVNHTDDSARTTSFTGVTGNATITIDSSYNYISDQYYLKFRSQNFPRLLGGSNTLTVRGQVSSISVTYNNRRNFL